MILSHKSMEELLVKHRSFFFFCLPNADWSLIHQVSSQTYSLDANLCLLRHYQVEFDMNLIFYGNKSHFLMLY